MKAFQRSLDTIYQIAPPAAYKRLQGFREAVPPRTYDVGKDMYRVWEIGSGSRAALFLPSGMGHGEIWFPYLTELSSSIRVIAISYPAKKTFEAYCQQIHELLRRLEVEKVILVGHAIGGLLAQTYVRLYPDEVEGMVLCMTGAPAKGLNTEDRNKWYERRKMFKNYLLSPFDPLRARMAYRTYYNMCTPELEEELLFWRAFIAETYEYHIFKKQHMYLNLRAVPDLYRRLPFDQEDLKDWPGRVMILQAEKDQYYSENEKQRLRDLYPNAQVEELVAAGQMALLADERHAIGLMRDFFDKR